MFRARGTRLIADEVQDAPAPAMPEPMPAPLPEPLPPLPPDPALAAALGMSLPQTWPALPPNIVDQVRAAADGDLQAIAAMRKLGEQVPAHLQVAFAEHIESLLG